MRGAVLLKLPLRRYLSICESVGRLTSNRNRIRMPSDRRRRAEGGRLREMIEEDLSPLSRTPLPPLGDAECTALAKFSADPT